MTWETEPFTTYAIFDYLRLLQVFLAVALATQLARASLDRYRLRTERWRLWFLLSLKSFLIASIFNGVQQLGSAPTPRLFFNMLGLVFGLLAISGLMDAQRYRRDRAS